METHCVTENLMRCGKLKEKDVQNEGDMWIRVADPFCCAVELTQPWIVTIIQ